MENFGIPNGLSHLKLLADSEGITLTKTKRYIEDHTDELTLFGICLCALYQAATCHRKCHGGNHVLESLSGRAYNLSVAAYHLVTIGYYDEALNLIRSIGEISNLIGLSVVDKDALQEWLSSDTDTRLRKFSPAKVRAILKKKGNPLMYADKDWYSNLCEKYTHVTPLTKPNFHNDDLAICGGVYQEKGAALTLRELTTVSTFVAMLICKYFKLDDLFSEIVTRVRIQSNC